jgi:ferredoxin
VCTGSFVPNTKNAVLNFTATILYVRVWIDQDLCTGDGLCVDYAPDVFTLLEDGIAYVVEEGKVCNDPGGSAQTAHVPEPLHRFAVDAADACPGECIFIEIDGQLVVE